jgi:hypothetical protein
MPTAAEVRRCQDVGGNVERIAQGASNSARHSSLKGHSGIYRANERLGFFNHGAARQHAHPALIRVSTQTSADISASSCRKGRSVQLQSLIDEQQ